MKHTSTPPFTPFADDTTIVATDQRGNELTIQNSLTSVEIYGQWQGSPEESSYLDIMSMIKKLKDSLAESKNLAPVRGHEEGTTSYEKNSYSVTQRKDTILIKIFATLYPTSAGELQKKEAAKLDKILSTMTRLRDKPAPSSAR